MDNREAVNWLINISADIGKAEHSDLWHYEQALTEIKDMLESAQLEERKESLCKKVRALCEESKIEFFFVGGGESTWSVTNDKHIKKIVECHKAQLSQEGTTTVAKSKRTFVELLVHYPHPDVCTYPEYKGKPYYSIKYIEDGECFVGFGTYKPEVLSQYLRDYFMPPAQPEERTKTHAETHACDCISRKDAIRWIKTECNPYGKPTLDFESGKRVMKHLEQMQPAQPEQRWILCSKRQPDANDWYITTISGEICGQDRAFSGMSEFANGKWMSGDDVDETEMTIAWMPMPEPYKEGETK